MTVPERDFSIDGPGPLSAGHLGAYRRNGFLLLPPDFLGVDTLSASHSAVDELLTEDSPRRIMERDGRTVRSVYGLHRTSPYFAHLVRRPELLAAVRQILGDDAYVHQSKVNIKAPFTGDQWEWHQDYIYWLQDDNIERPDLVNVAVFLDDVTEFNGPLSFVPGSHRDGVLSATAQDGMPLGYEQAPGWVSTLTADEKFKVDAAVIERQARANGIVAPKGPAGSVLFFHANLLHSSAQNISPFRRAMLIFVYNAVGNAPRPVARPRPDFLAEPDVRALTPADPAATGR